MSEPALIDEPDAPVIRYGFWRSVAQALQGKEQDYTALPLRRAVLLLAVPMVLEMVMESIFAVVDVFWVSHLGRDAVAIVGITESVMSLVYAVAIGLAIAATATVARRIGEKDPGRASEAAGQILLLSVGISAAMGMLLGYFAPDILRMMGASEAVSTGGAHFARVMLGGNATVFMIFVLNAIFRGAGDAVIAMRTLWLANALNIALGPCFIFGWGPFPELGVTGAAVATNVGRGVGVLYQLWHLAGGSGQIRVRLRHLIPDRELITVLLRTAGPGMAQMLITTTSWVGLFKILAQFGSAALAGYTIAIRMIIFGLLPASGLANAGATLVGQNLGAGKPDRAEAAVRLAVRYNVAVLGLLALVFIALSGPIVGLFTTDPEVFRYAHQSLWIVSLGFPLYAAGMCFEGAFNGAGDSSTPTRLNFFCLWLGQIPLAWILSDVFHLGPVGAFIAVPAAFSALAICGFVLFRRGKWKLQKV